MAARPPAAWAEGDACSGRLLDPHTGRNIGCRGRLQAVAATIVERPGRPRAYYTGLLPQGIEAHATGSTTLLVCPRCAATHGKPRVAP